MTELLGTFLDQPGTPLVETIVTCAGDEEAELDLSQRRYLPRGSRAEQGKAWSVPAR